MRCMHDKVHDAYVCVGQRPFNLYRPYTYMYCIVLCAKVAEGLRLLSEGFGVLSFDLGLGQVIVIQNPEAMINGASPCHMI